MNEFLAYRRHVHQALSLLIWLYAPLNIAVAYYMGASWLLIGGASLALAIVASAVARLAEPAIAQATIPVALMGTMSLMLGAAAGGAWQTDLHMAYFAGVALAAIYCDPIAIVAAAATVALHHLTLNFLLPEAIYPGGSDFPRVVLHAAILIVEAGGLVWLTSIIQRAFERADKARAAAEAARGAAEQAVGRVNQAEANQRRELEERHALQAHVADQQGATVKIFADKLARLAAGDLTARVDEEIEGAFAPMKRDFNAAIEKLAAAFANVSDRALAVSDGAHQIAEAAENLSSRTEMQASSLNETSSALGRVVETVKASTEGAMKASGVVNAADQDAKQSAEVVDKAIAAMAAITDSSSKIGQIIGVIDEIAFQTNLLALNAGVEAARAGETGRGFAVVASEVRALAQRSAQAAKEIKELIQTSIDQVDHGAKLVTETGEALSRIAGKVSEITEAVGGISASASEQLTSLSEINAAIDRMDQITQENAGMAEEATAASRSLATETAQLGELVNQFDVGRAGSDQRLKRELKKVAPHAFAAPKKTPPKPAAPASRPKVVNDDWNEF